MSNEGGIPKGYGNIQRNTCLQWGVREVFPGKGSSSLKTERFVHVIHGNVWGELSQKRERDSHSRENSHEARVKEQTNPTRNPLCLRNCVWGRGRVRPEVGEISRKITKGPLPSHLRAWTWLQGQCGGPWKCLRWGGNKIWFALREGLYRCAVCDVLRDGVDGAPAAGSSGGILRSNLGREESGPRLKCQQQIRDKQVGWIWKMCLWHNSQEQGKEPKAAS